MSFKKTQLETLVNTTISNYNRDELKDFNRPFRYSKLTGLIDNTDTAILSNITTVTLARLVTPTTTTTTAYTLNFNNPFFHPHDVVATVVVVVVAVPVVEPPPPVVVTVYPLPVVAVASTFPTTLVFTVSISSS